MLLPKKQNQDLTNLQKYYAYRNNAIANGQDYMDQSEYMRVLSQNPSLSANVSKTSPGIPLSYSPGLASSISGQELPVTLTPEHYTNQQYADYAAGVGSQQVSSPTVNSGHTRASYSPEVLNAYNNPKPVQQAEGTPTLGGVIQNPAHTSHTETKINKTELDNWQKGFLGVQIGTGLAGTVMQYDQHKLNKKMAKADYEAAKYANDQYKAMNQGFADFGAQRAQQRASI